MPTVPAVGVDLVTLVPTLQRALNPPGLDLFPAATEAEWVGRLADAFWKARLAGFFAGYRETTGDVMPVDPTAPDLTREEQEIIIAYARVTALQNRLVNLATGSRSKAGPVESETQRSAQVLVQMLKDATNELADVAALVPQTPRQAVFLDAVYVRTASIAAGTGSGWVG